MMSGTSLDGLDLTYCYFFRREGQWRFEIIAADTYEYDADWKKRLATITEASGEQLMLTHQELGVWMGEAVNRFVRKNQVDPEFVATHGHTVFHQPERALTLQIGSSFAMRAVCEKPVISNFRDMDLALGGQGAPLVPIGDRLLFGKYAFCLNIGGIANISAEVGDQRLAYDICPANMVLNHFAQKAGKPYDAGGALAAGGKVQENLLVRLNALDYYQASFPKSLGYEWVLAHVIRPLEKEKITTEDMLATLTHHVAQQIAQNALMLQEKEQALRSDADMLVTGGGAFNDYLVSCIQQYGRGRFQVVSPNELIISYKEALVFAFLGVLRLRKEINCLSSVTGASRDHSAGVIYE
jgi:anhydro-N-acetylmuramic acid kinase